MQQDKRWVPQVFSAASSAQSTTLGGRFGLCGTSAAATATCAEPCSWFVVVLSRRRRDIELEAKEEEELALRVEAAVQTRVEEAMASAEVQARIAVRLQEERAKLEEQVTAQLEREKRLLLEKNRREQEERVRQKQEMERILEENRRKVGARAWGWPLASASARCRVPD